MVDITLVHGLSTVLTEENVSTYTALGCGLVFFFFKLLLPVISVIKHWALFFVQCRWWFRVYIQNNSAK